MIDLQAAAPMQRRRPRRARPAESQDRSVISDFDRSRPGVRVSLGAVQLLILAGLSVSSILPILWLFKASISTTGELLSQPLALWPSTPQWDHFREAWVDVRIGEYLLNTFWLAAGSLFFTLTVSVTGAYVLSVLRPRWAPILNGALLATLFIPGVISLVPLYLTVLDLPGFGVSLLNTFWAVWLPSAASAFSVIVVKRFFDALPRELFDAARVDGAGTVRVLVSIVAPLSRPILGVVGLLTVIGSYKEYLWPLLVLPEPSLQPVSVALPRVDQSIELSVQMAALFLSLIIPVVLFLLLQRQFLRGVSLSGGVKG